MNIYLHEELGEVQVPLDELPLPPIVPVFPVPFPPAVADDVEEEDEGDGEGDA